MINIRTLKKIENDGGLTLKNGKPIVYKTGYQVGIEGKVTSDMRQAMIFIKEYKGNCGIWFSEGLWYIDKSVRVTTKANAIALGKSCNQISILNWRTMGLVYC